MSRETRRRFVPLPERLIDEAIKTSERIGMPYLVLLEKIIETNLSILRYKPTLLQTIIVIDTIDDMRRLGGVLTPWSILKQVINNIDESTFSELLEETSRLSTVFGELMRIKHGSSPRIFEASVSTFISNALIDIIQEENETYKCVVSFVDSSPRTIQLAETIVKGLAKGLGVNIFDLRRGDSTITLKLGGFYEKD